MHRRLRTLLENATGSSDDVVALNIDIRDFSGFNATVGDANTAHYVKKLYIKLMDDYFGDASFCKPTGDGLLVTLPYTERTLAEVATAAVERSLKIVECFGTLLEADHMIRAARHPQDVGIGIARGPTMRLSSGRTVLDYSGRVLNLATRLMGIARPAGVVLEGDFGIDLLADPLASEFVREEGIYLQGFAEVEPISVYYSKSYTQIPASAKRPLAEYKWETENFPYTKREIDQMTGWWWYRPRRSVANESRITVRLHHPKPTPGGRPSRTAEVFPDLPFEYGLDAGRPYVRVDMGDAQNILNRAGAKDGWKCVVRMSYPTFDEPTTADDDIPF